MNFTKYFVLVFVVLAVTIGFGEAAPRWKGWKKIVRILNLLFKTFFNIFNCYRKKLAGTFSRQLKRLYL